MMDLIERLSALTGPDRRLDAEIDCAVRFPHLRPSEPTDFDGKYGYQPRNIKCEHGFLMANDYTGSLDAKLPGENIVTVMKTPSGFRCEHAEVAPDGTFTSYTGEAATEAIARRIAALRARMADRSGA